MMWLSGGERISTIRLAILTWYRRVIGRKTISRCAFVNQCGRALKTSATSTPSHSFRLCRAVDIFAAVRIACVLPISRTAIALVLYWSQHAMSRAHYTGVVVARCAFSGGTGLTVLTPCVRYPSVLASVQYMKYSPAHVDLWWQESRACTTLTDRSRTSLTVDQTIDPLIISPSSIQKLFAFLSLCYVLDLVSSKISLLESSC